MINVKKSCENCRWHYISICRCDDNFKNWQPDYNTLSQQLIDVQNEIRKYKEALQIACYDINCSVCPLQNKCSIKTDIPCNERIANFYLHKSEVNNE